MNRETLINFIKNFGAQDMSAVAMLVMRKALCLTPMNVDGPGDGGRDIIFTSYKENETHAVQITAQDRGWEEKIRNDLQKISKFQHVDLYTVFVRHVLTEKVKRSLTEEIYSKYGTRCMLYGAREISSLLIESDLVGDFCTTIIGDNNQETSSFVENNILKTLYAYYMLSEDRKDFNKEILNSAVIYTVSEVRSIARPELVKAAMKLLLLDDSRTEEIESRIDGLLSKGKLSKNKMGDIFLSPEIMREVLLSNKAYERSLQRFASFCDEIIRERIGTEVENLSERIAISVAKCYVQQQIETAKNALIDIRMSGLSGSFQSSYADLQALLRQSGIPAPSLDEVTDRILSASAGSEIVRQLASAVLYIGIRQSPNVRSAVILNADSWKDVNLNLDSSVAIPAMATYLYGATERRFSKVAERFLAQMGSLGTRLYIPSDYLNECASHLMAATRYCFEFHDLDDAFASSHNGFVEHYFQLKKKGNTNVPPTLKEYLRNFSSAVFANGNGRADNVRLRVESDLSNLLQECGISERNYQCRSSGKMRIISEEYAYQLKNCVSERSSHQERHDVHVMAALDALPKEGRSAQILATWDRILIAVANKLNLSFWAVNPAECYDLVQGQTRFSDMELLSIGNALSRIKGRKDELAGRMIDRIVGLCNEKLNNADYRRNLIAIKNEVCARCESIGYDKCFDEFEQRLFDFDTELKKAGCEKEQELRI